MASFTSPERGKKMVKQIVGDHARKCPLELSEVQANKENIQVALVPACVLKARSPRVPSSFDTRFTAKQKQHIVLYARRHGVHCTEMKFSKSSSG